ncbi:single-stranded-DNA-specific exonuclease RecJ [Hyphomicrobium denitrificans 1NES1]|uniref:Single-stranded-DNA-specific exonuclease RecJ n=1 Tax=Hyphomicrobium denitrificans 1NES1 TaxID=670307 RepID=N0BBZ0_9HYPH|nr:single-stranded-DNA-specific exonuclease RecJ [Hyphomicrobium denitrificans 1NES1]
MGAWPAAYVRLRESTYNLATGSRGGAPVRSTSLAKVAFESREDGAAFLGVRASARGFHWRERLRPELRSLATAIGQHHGLPELMGRILAARGIGLEAVPGFLDPTLKSLMPDPSALRDMDKAASRLADAIEARQRIAIFGDYDVDGACSSALLNRFLSHHDVPSRIYIPDRLFEGYGPNVGAIEALVNEGARLIVTVDCGTTSFEPLAAARKLGADVVVIDHHQADERLPEVEAVVNPNRQDDVSGQGMLCAAGVVFLVLVAVTRELRRRGFYRSTREPDLLALLDLVALATVADVVPLTGLNRAYVKKGLAVMRARENVGLTALADAAGLTTPPTPYHLGFIFGPRINAGGRIGNAALGATLLSTTDPVEAQKIAELLNRLNKERKDIETTMLEEALAIADRQMTDDPSRAMIVVASETWHKGVVGLVASRLVERFRRPACVIAWEAEASRSHEGTGSLRSVPGVDLGSAVRAAVAAGLLIKGGGHAMAAGLTVGRQNLAALETHFLTQLGTVMVAVNEAAGLDIDAALVASGATVELMDLIERVSPFGQGNPEARFVLPAHRVKFAKVVGDTHARVLLEGGDGARLDAIAFRAAGQPLGDLLMSAGGMPLHVAGHLRRDTWGGRDRVELQIEDAADPRRQP